MILALLSMPTAKITLPRLELSTQAQTATTRDLCTVQTIYPIPESQGRNDH